MIRKDGGDSVAISKRVETLFSWLPSSSISIGSVTPVLFSVPWGVQSTSTGDLSPLPSPPIRETIVPDVPNTVAVYHMQLSLQLHIPTRGGLEVSELMMPTILFIFTYQAHERH